MADITLKAARVVLAMICCVATIHLFRFFGFNLLSPLTFLHPIFWIAAVLVRRLLFAGNSPPIMFGRRRGRFPDEIQQRVPFRAVRVELAVICYSIGIWSSLIDGFSRTPFFLHPIFWIATILVIRLLFGGDTPPIILRQRHFGGEIAFKAVRVVLAVIYVWILVLEALPNPFHPMWNLFFLHPVFWFFAAIVIWLLFGGGSPPIRLRRRNAGFPRKIPINWESVAFRAGRGVRRMLQTLYPPMNGEM